MLAHELIRDKGILVLRPQGPLKADDFESVGKLVDPYIAQTGLLHGLMIEASSFPGWDSFAALLSHVRFIRDHHRLVVKVATVSDGAASRLGRKSRSISSRPRSATSTRTRGRLH